MAAPAMLTGSLEEDDVAGVRPLFSQGTDSAARTVPWPMRLLRRSGPTNDDQPNEKGTATMKLTTVTNVSVDGGRRDSARRMRSAGADASATEAWDIGAAVSESRSLLGATCES